MFSEAIHDPENCVVVVTWRQIRDPIQGHAALRFIEDREGVREAIGRVSHHLVPLARITALHVGLDSCSKPLPLEVSPHECLRPRHAIVARQRRVVVLAEDVED